MTSGDAVTDFYEHHPYPPPVTSLDRTIEAWRDGQRRTVEHFRRWPARPYRDDHSILVAGCGTSQAAKYAARYPRASVVGIDISAASLDHTRTLADRHGVENLELQQRPVEEAGGLGTHFDHIVCTGVLHHLADPAVGLHALRDALAPSGAIELMLYAPYGRTGIYMLQDYARRLGITPAPDDIAELVSTLRELPIGHPLGHLLRNTPDFDHPDALADALLHPRDQAFSVAEIYDFLEGADLSFGRWVRQGPYLPGCGALRSLAHGQRIAALPAAEQHTALELFRGTMTRHSFIGHHRGEAPAAIDFGGDAWPDYRPIRTTTAIAVEQNLPPGAAAALLNTAHTYPDLVLLADERQRQVFDQIDGHRTISEIAGDDASLFERMWWQDLIVLDTTEANRS